MFKQQTQKLGNAFRRMRGDMSTPWQRLLGYLDMLFVDHGFIRVIYSNTHRVSPRMYRSAQLTPYQIARAAKRGIKTIVNLRGARDCGSYLLQKEVCARHGMTMIDFPLSSRDAPRKTDLRNLQDIFSQIEYPALLHCKSGADRAGIASALWVLLHGGSSARALAHLSWRFGHIRQSRTGILDAFILRYRRDAEGRKPFLDWVREDYDREALLREFRANGLASFVNDWVLAHE